MESKLLNACKQAQRWSVLCAVLAAGVPALKLQAQTNQMTSNVTSTASLEANAVISPPSTSPTTPATDNSTDAKVLSQLHQIDQLEIKMGNLAMQKGRSEKIRAYGKRLQNDHQLTERKVAMLAAEKNLTLTKADAAQQQQADAMAQKLQSAQGKEFDQTFLNAMIKGHTEAIQMLSEERQNLQDPEIRDLISRTIPILEQHLHLAKNIESNN